MAKTRRIRKNSRNINRRKISKRSNIKKLKRKFFNKKISKKISKRSNIKKLKRKFFSKKISKKISTPIKMNISEKTYKKLLDMKKNKKTLSKYQEKNLDKALHIKYCTCVKSLKYGQKNKSAYGICANSVYKNRGIDMPFRSAINCKKYKK